MFPHSSFGEMGQVGKQVQCAADHRNHTHAKLSRLACANALQPHTL